MCVAYLGYRCTPELPLAAACGRAAGSAGGRFICLVALRYSFSAEATLATHCARYSCKSSSVASTLEDFKEHSAFQRL